MNTQLKQTQIAYAMGKYENNLRDDWYNNSDESLECAHAALSSKVQDMTLAHPHDYIGHGLQRTIITWDGSGALSCLRLRRSVIQVLLQKKRKKH